MNPIGKMSLLLSACVIALCAGSPVEFRALDTGIAPLADDVNYRLSDDVIPTIYDLELTPYFENVRLRAKLIISCNDNCFITGR